MRWRRYIVLLPLVLFAGPVAMLGGQVSGSEWWQASREPAGLAPDPATTPEAVVQVYAARAFSWRGAFGVHTWIAVKPSGAARYRIYQVIGWHLRHGGQALSIAEDIPDRYWYGNRPELLVDLRGAGVDAIIRRIDSVARAYPYATEYRLWPGPNSNTFTAWVARRVPELRLDLPPTAIGKDWLGADGPVAETPSGTGYQFSLFGVLGVLVGREEGIEVNIAGLSFGVDPLDLALRLPGVGRLALLSGRGDARAAGRD